MPTKRTEYVIHGPTSWVDYDKPWVNQRQVLVTDQTASFLSNFLAIFLSLALKNLYNVGRRIWLVYQKRREAKLGPAESDSDSDGDVDQPVDTLAIPAHAALRNADAMQDEESSAMDGSNEAPSTVRPIYLQRMEVVEDSRDPDDLSWKAFKRFFSRLQSIIPMRALDDDNTSLYRRMATLKFWSAMRDLAKESSGDLVWHFLVGFAALCVYFGTLVIGIWSSYPLIGDSVALSNHPGCGLVTPNRSRFPDHAYSTLGMKYLNDIARESKQYAKSCYGSASDPLNALGQDSCSFFYTTSLDYISIDDAKCPFKAGDFPWCPGGDHSAFQLVTWSPNTGNFLDASALGINSPEPYSFFRSLSCSPRHLGDLVSPFVPGKNGTLNHRYFYGNHTKQPNCTENAPYCTFEIPVTLVEHYAYNLYYASTSWAHSWTWHPLFSVDEARGQTATVILIDNIGIGYPNKSTDPMYPAETEGDSGWWYNFKFHASVLGCMSTTLACYEPDRGHKTCVDRDHVSQLGGSDDPEHQASRDLLLSALSYDLEHQLVMGAEILDAQTMLSGSSSSEMPQDQWKIEVRQMFESMLARMQIEARNVARARGVGNKLDDHVEVTLPGKHVYCTRYKFRAEGWKNISVTWLIVELLVGLMACVLGVTRENGELWIETYFDRLIKSRLGSAVGCFINKCVDCLQMAWMLLRWVCTCCWPARRSSGP